MVLNIQLGDIGLVLDLVGAILLFTYGLAPLLSKDGSMSLSAGTSDYIKRKARKYELLSRTGIGLIIVGFAFQLVGNHTSWSTNIDLATMLLVLVGLIVGVLLIITASRKWKRKYVVRAQYVPQFDKTKPTHGGEHMWIFVIDNNSRHFLTATLHLKTKPSTVALLEIGKQPETIEPSKKIELKNVEPSTSVRVQIWGMGGHITDGLDCYLQVDKKIVRPKVLTLDDE